MLNTNKYRSIKLKIQALGSRFFKECFLVVVNVQKVAEIKITHPLEVVLPRGKDISFI